jgi:7,8-dihydro-6-hydroxymethylpterin-pyrophosphokinase
LFPLQEIAPKWMHPETKDSIDVLINKLSNEDKKSILKIKKS